MKGAIYLSLYMPAEPLFLTLGCRALHKDLTHTRVHVSILFKTSTGDDKIGAGTDYVRKSLGSGDVGTSSSCGGSSPFREELAANAPGIVYDVVTEETPLQVSAPSVCARSGPGGGVYLSGVAGGAKCGRVAGRSFGSTGTGLPLLLGRCSCTTSSCWCPRMTGRFGKLKITDVPWTRLRLTVHFRRDSNCVREMRCQSNESLWTVH